MVYSIPSPLSSMSTSDILRMAIIQFILSCPTGLLALRKLSLYPTTFLMGCLTLTRLALRQPLLDQLHSYVEGHLKRLYEMQRHEFLMTEEEYDAYKEYDAYNFDMFDEGAF